MNIKFNDDYFTVMGYSLGLAAIILFVVALVKKLTRRKPKIKHGFR